MSRRSGEWDTERGDQTPSFNDSEQARNDYGFGGTSPGGSMSFSVAPWASYYQLQNEPGAKQMGEGIHNEFLQFCRETGIEDIAKHSGLVHNGELGDLKTYSTSTSTSTKSAPSSTTTVWTIPAPEFLPVTETFPSSREPQPHATTTPASTTSTQQRTLTPAATNSVPAPTLTLATPDDATRKESSTPPTPSSGDLSSSARKKRRTQSRGSKNKGLRHFSLKVCEKVQSKRVTTYNEVADELVTELQKLAAAGQAEGMGNNKNIRRRVYDALNVLMAMDIITKEKKEIRWVGLPTNSKQDLHELEADREDRVERIRKKTDHLEELASQQRSYSNLLARNAKGTSAHLDASSKIHLPFILVNTRNTTEIECEMAEDHSEYFFNFSAPFEIHDDTEVLKRAGMDGHQTVAPIKLT